MLNWEFANPEFLYALIILPAIIAWYVLSFRKKHPSLSYSGTGFLTHTGLKTKLIHVPFSLRILAIGTLIVALSRPQSATSWQDVTTEGIDIVIALDVSGSMLARDFKPDRLEAAKEVGVEFIQSRPTDRIGLVVYAGESFSQCPLTTDHDKLVNLFEGIKHGMIEDGTAIGMGLANAVNRLKESDAKSKVIILLTDGENTAGSIPPVTAAEIAATFGVKVYTIGVGTIGQAPYPAKDMFGRTVMQMYDVKIDEETLQQIAEITNGKYFRATDKDKLQEIYNEIDQLEKTIIEETQYEKKNEEFLPLTLLALGMIILEQFLKRTTLKSALTDV
ncbi:MAG: VWA domain-containing protein [Salibacteraceae bacterium]